MTEEQALYEKFAAAAGVQAVYGNPVRIFQDVTPPSPTRPYAVMQRISAPHEHHYGGSSGLVTVRIQVDTYGSTKASVAAGAEALRQAADGFEGTITSGLDSTFVHACWLESDNGEIVPPVAGKETSERRWSQDWMVAATETKPNP